MGNVQALSILQTYVWLVPQTGNPGPHSELRAQSVTSAGHQPSKGNYCKLTEPKSFMLGGDLENKTAVICEKKALIYVNSDYCIS